MYTHITPILQCIGPCDLFRSFRSIFLYNIKSCFYALRLYTDMSACCVNVLRVGVSVGNAVW